MNWNDQLLQQIQERLISGSTIPKCAAELTVSLGEQIHPEQLRGALRRYAARVNYGRMEATKVNKERIMNKSPKKYERDVVQEIRFAAIGDTHLCSNYERIDILEMLYTEFEKAGIDTVYHTGNYIDGEAAFNANDIHVHGLDNQCTYFANNFPYRDDIHTYYIDGDDHEGWYTQKHGIIIGQHLEDICKRIGRSDVHYLGYMESDIALFPELGDSSPKMRVLHPGGGSSYALSYTGQKIIDSYEDYDKPDILLIGHYHKASLLPNYRGVVLIQTGCMQEPTPFMRKKRLHADLGGWIITVGINKYAKVTKVVGEFISYPMNPWKYK